jgi:hypothetical protein
MAKYMLKSGATIFYDEYSIKLGDSLTQKINQGLQNAKFAIIILSEAFFQKNWTQAELQSIYTLHVSDHLRLIIIYHGISNEDVRRRYPLLSDIYSVSSDRGVEGVVGKIFEDTGFQSQIQYIRTQAVEAGKGIDVAKTGFHVAIRFELGHLYERSIDKYIFDMGEEGSLSNRSSIFIRDNKYIVWQLSSSKNSAISLFCSAEKFIKRPKMLCCVLTPKQNNASMYIDEILVSEMKNLPKFFIKSLNLESGTVLFNSIDLVNPCPATVSMHSFGGAIDAVAFAHATNTLVDELTKNLSN